MRLDEELAKLRRWPLFGYAITALVLLLATLVRLSMPDQPVFITFFPAVLIAALAGGVVAGILAICGAILISWYYLLPPSASFIINSHQIGTLILFALSAGLMVLLVDRNEQIRARFEQESWLRALAMRVARLGAWRWHEGRPAEWDDSLRDLTSVAPGQEPSYEAIRRLIDPQDRPKLEEAVRALREGKEGQWTTELCLRLPDGSRRWLSASSVAIRRVSGELDRFGVVQDITQQKERDEKIALLMREMAHRIKNQFSVIMAMARQTGRHAGTIAEFQEAYLARLEGLARSHDLLVKEECTGATIDDLARAQLQPFLPPGKSALRLEGPKVTLSPQAVQYLGLAFHELATNATKYGALSPRGGDVVIAWQISAPPGEGRQLHLQWRESCPRDLSADQSSSGFGQEAITRLVPAALNGSARLEFTGEGLTWLFEAPAEGLAPAASIR